MKISKHSPQEKQLSIEHRSGISALFSLLSNSELNSKQTINLVASENVLSPMAKLPFLFDLHTRYFLDDIKRFGKWYFPGGSTIREIEENILMPLMSEMVGATYVNVRPISGMNCMTIVLASLTNPGDTFLSVPVENGGHVSTSIIAHKLGREIKYIPFSNAYDIDYDSLKKLLINDSPSLIYLDQSMLLFPIDPQPLRDLIDAISPNTTLYYDSSHTNGLIIGKALFNPLDRGAHGYGGSTHKTLPGPHKGFIATNDKKMAIKIQETANHLVSHHHTSSTISLAITLMEMKYCHGDQYAKAVIENAKAFAAALAKNGFYVVGNDRGYTACHQVWASTEPAENAQQLYDILTEVGIITNLFDTLPGIQQSSFRLSIAEVTKLGATTEDVQGIAVLMSKLLKDPHIQLDQIKKEVRILSKKLSKPKFCFALSDLDKNSISEDMQVLCKALFKVGYGHGHAIGHD